MNENTNTTQPATPVTPATPQEDELAQRARRAHEAWLEGPSEEEMIAWARQERMRRVYEAEMQQREAQPSNMETQQLAQRYSREAQLAVEGAVYLLFTAPWRLYSSLVHNGREFEGGISSFGPPRRVRLDIDLK